MPALPPAPPAPAINEFHLSGFDWRAVNRVLILPPYNRSAYPRAAAEIRGALAQELQRLGLFEVVSPPPDHPACHAEYIHVNGRFDEAAMLTLGHAFNADLVIHVAISQYDPYNRPRLGLVVQAVAPQEAKVVASVDGLWDASCPEIAMRARAYYASPSPTLLRQYIAGPPTPIDGRADELALESPRLFQSFVCSEVAAALVGLSADARSRCSE